MFSLGEKNPATKIAIMDRGKKKKKEETPKRDGGDPFEFCDVCRLNHDQGRRHRYFPSHVRSLSSLLSRSQQKIADLRSSLRNPSTPSPRDRFWCVFCSVDVREPGGSVPCCNAINHLASSEHLRNLKGFLRKHGGGVDRIDSFRVSDEELAEWEKACKSLKSAASTSGQGTIGPFSVPLKVMRVIDCILKILVEPRELAQFPTRQLLFQWTCREIWVCKMCMECRIPPV